MTKHTHSHRHRYQCLLLSVLLLIGLSASRGAALPPQVSEYEVKAAFLYNFAKYVAWPSHTAPVDEPPFLIGIIGDDPFGDILDRAVAGKTIKGRPIVLERFQAFHRVRESQVLFISASAAPDLDTIFAHIQDAPILTVSDMEDFAAHGGIIQLIMRARKVRFAVNIDAARHADLHVSSQLLKLATQVFGTVDAP